MSKPMIEDSPSPPADVSLMLRVHAELRCLSHEVIPVLRQIETRRDLPEDQLGAALAYLEVTWMQAREQARETDCAYAALVAAGGDTDIAAPTAGAGAEALRSRACRYRNAVLVLRRAVTSRVTPLLDTPIGEIDLPPAATQRSSL